MPVVSIPTPFGTANFGNAGVGLCGGMIYTAIDLFLFGLPVPPEPTEPVVRYISHRLLDSFNFPFGWMKYLDWQVRHGHSTRLLPGITELTARDWPRIKAVLDAGQLCPLGLVKIQSWDPFQLGHNHQVLAYGYEYDDATSDLTVQIYDPNFPADPCELRTNLNEPTRQRQVRHSIEGETVRGFFPTDYRRPAVPPVFDCPAF
jgi:hypothetical protein